MGLSMVVGSWGIKNKKRRGGGAPPDLGSKAEFVNERGNVPAGTAQV